MNPATFLRVLGPEPWRVAYVETTVRPDDARYGENPNRMGVYYQYQVILKPDPGNPQEVFLRSLEALGINPREHDIRFVEDRWEAPPLGAWGLGWEVWLDGLEITQFTYFQQAGGMSLDPVSVEITYGLERILMAVQRVGHFSEIRWDGRRSYGDLLLTAEQEHSKYFFESANVVRLKQMFGDFEQEAQLALESGLVFPAYDYLLKCSHTFNVLDARGSIGVTERASYFGKMREIARQVARAYLAERERLGFPWREPSEPRSHEAPVRGRPPAQPTAFVLELGTEELPVGDLTDAISQFEAKLPPLLEELRLEHRGIEVTGTPRRLVVHVKGLAPRQTDRTRTLKGPPANRAFDANGNPTAAARGFAKSAGVPIRALQTQDLAGGRYVVAEVTETGLAAAGILAEALPGLLASLQFEHPMRWDASGTAFARPIRWLLALHGGCLVGFEYAGLRSGRTTRGLRASQAVQIRVRTPSDYFDRLRRAGILLDRQRRQAAISRQILRLASAVKGKVVDDPELLEEVTNLVEAPVALRGGFDRSHLDLPREVLVSVMKVHQRYFPVESKGGLLPYFIAVGNGVGGRQVIHGHEQVIRARFADAAYFVGRDLRQPLEDYVPRLETLTFQADLGSMLDKSRRIERLVERLADPFELTTSERGTALRAARLCKADLATQMVKDMTSLQGAMGRYYALQSGEPQAVAEAILEHYQPRTPGDELPKSGPGVVMAVADRLDSLIGLFAIGVQPTGTRDPYALRRAALGVVQILTAQRQNFDLRIGLGWALEGLGRTASKQALPDCLDFISARQQRLLLGEGWPHDVIEAVLVEQGHNPHGAALAVEALAAWVNQPDWPKILQAYARCVRITRDIPGLPSFSPDRIVEPATRELHAAILAAEQQPRRIGSVVDFVEAFLPLIPAIDRFFDEVLVMTDERALRENRLALLQRVVKLADGVADFSKLEGF
jgi:glycyl-tRNA synthetase